MMEACKHCGCVDFHAEDCIIARLQKLGQRIEKRMERQRELDKRSGPLGVNLST